MYFDARGMTTLRIYAANKEKITVVLNEEEKNCVQ